MRKLYQFKAIQLATIAGILLFSSQTVAEIIPNPVAEFAGLDKITGRITSFDVYLNETREFGSLKVTPRVCNSRPLTEKPHTIAFIEVDELTLENQEQRIFTGWMLASSPALNAVEHGVYDIWLTDCKNQTTVLPPENYAGLPVEIIEVKETQDIESLVKQQTKDLSSAANKTSVKIPIPRLKPKSIQ